MRQRSIDVSSSSRGAWLGALSTLLSCENSGKPSNRSRCGVGFLFALGASSNHRTLDPQTRGPPKIKPLAVKFGGRGFLAGRCWEPQLRIPGFSHAHFLPSSSSPAFAKSSGLMTTLSSTSALNVRNQGSANDGILDASGRSTMRMQERLPCCSVK